MFLLGENIWQHACNTSTLTMGQHLAEKKEVKNMAKVGRIRDRCKYLPSVTSLVNNSLPTHSASYMTVLFDNYEIMKNKLLQSTIWLIRNSFLLYFITSRTLNFRKINLQLSLHACTTLLLSDTRKPMSLTYYPTDWKKTLNITITLYV